MFIYTGSPVETQCLTYKTDLFNLYHAIFSVAWALQPNSKKHWREVQHWGVYHLIVVYIYKAIIRNYPGRANFYSLLASGDQNYFYSKTFLDWKISDSYSIRQAGKEVVIANLIQAQHGTLQRSSCSFHNRSAFLSFCAAHATNKHHATQLGFFGWPKYAMMLSVLRLLCDQ